MNVSRPFIERPVATSLLAAALLVAGIVAHSRLPVAPMPRVDLPTIQVQANLPGASPETMASAVATPLERRFGRIAGITEITSSSALGSTSLVLQFDLDRDQDSCARDVQAAINAAGGELPTNMPSRPNYRKANPSDTPILIVSMTSETLPLSSIFDTANSVLAQKIAQVEGVGQVFIGGGQQPAVRVQADPTALASVGLSLESLRTAIMAATVNSPKGILSGPIQAHTIGANDQLFGAERFKALVVSKDAAGNPVRLNEVARVIDDVENNRVAAWANGKRAILMIVRRQPGANILDTIDRVKALLPDLEKSISPQIEVRVVLDRAQTIRASVHDVEMTLLLAVGLVIMVVFLFLRRLGATAIPSVAVPLSLLGTFCAMLFLGYSLNNLSLMALTISTGFVVDDAIVVTENVMRYVEKGEDPMSAALKGAKQIGFTIVSITVSLLAVFIPILMMGGIVGRLFREFAVTLAVAIVMSAVVSLTLTPMMCARLLAHRSEHKPNVVERGLERAFDWLQRGYERGLDWVLRHRVLMLLVTIGTVVLSVYLYIVVPKGLFPQQDTGFLMGSSEAPPDVSFTTMRDRQNELGKILMKDPDIANSISFTGGGGGSTGNSGSFFIDLEKKPKRKASADQIINRLRPKLGRLPGINLYLQAAQDVRIGGRGSKTQYQYTVQDVDLAELRAWAPKVLEKLKGLKELADVASDLQRSGLEARLVIDRDTADRYGVTLRAIDDTLYDAFGQRQVATNFTELNQYRVVLEVIPELQSSLETIQNLHVASRTGELIPLRSMSRLEMGGMPLTINHQGQFPSVTLSFNLAPGVALGQAVDAIHQMEGTAGFPAGLRAGFQGTAQAFKSSLSDQPMLILLALLTVYIVLGILYESLVHPLTILSTLPSAGVGALLALMLFGAELSVIAMIGIVLLIGIVKKNAIMMIDFALEAERVEGLSTEESIRKACLLRFRPIMMTTMAALLGGLPLALGAGLGSELRQPLGIAIVGGLLTSQALTLFTTPVVYLWMDRLSSKQRRGLSLPQAAEGAA